MGDTTADPREGWQFGPYRLRRLLGRGGMGNVYEAEDTVRERIVALKLMSDALSNDPVFRLRMQREARIAGRLKEPHIVPIHDFGEIDGRLFVDMRLIEGVDLATVLSRDGPLVPARAVALVHQIASALDAAHAAGVMHRDVKPENILVAEHDFAYLVDFGIASATADEKLTQMGSAVGTLRYMAPERFTESEVTYRVDIYALACVLYECLIGSPPYQGSQANLVNAHLYQPIPRPSALRPGIPIAMDQVIACGMAKNPADRYATPADLSKAAHAALATPDQDRASDILRRSQEVILPESGFVAPSAGAAALLRPQSPVWPAPSAPASPVAAGAPAPRPVSWWSAPSSGVGIVRSTAAPSLGQSGALPDAEAGAPPWGQPPPQMPPGRRKFWPWVGGALAVMVAIVVGVVIFLAHPWSPSPLPPPPSPPADAVKLQVLDDGVLVGSSAAPTTIDIFDEPICPPCGVLNRSYEGDIETAVNNKKLAVRWHLLNFLDDKSHSQNYSTRAVAATYCVAAQNDPQLYTAFYSALFDTNFQPQEGGSTDRTDAELSHLAQTAGADSSVLSCIKFGDDIDSAKTKAAKGLATINGLHAAGTPLVWDGRKAVNTNDPNWLNNLIK
jgi:serine/threonine-protein kinase